MKRCETVVTLSPSMTMVLHWKNAIILWCGRWYNAIMTFSERMSLLCSVFWRTSPLQPFIRRRVSRRRGKPEKPKWGKFRSVTRTIPTSNAIIASIPACTTVDGSGRPGTWDGKSRGAGDMAVTAWNAWNVARHAAPAQSHGAIHRLFGPLFIRFWRMCLSSFCQKDHQRRQRIKVN